MQPSPTGGDSIPKLVKICLPETIPACDFLTLIVYKWAWKLPYMYYINFNFDFHHNIIFISMV